MTARERSEQGSRGLCPTCASSKNVTQNAATRRYWCAFCERAFRDPTDGMEASVEQDSRPIYAWGGEWTVRKAAPTTVRDDDRPSNGQPCAICGSTTSKRAKWLNRPGEVICKPLEGCGERETENHWRKAERARIVAIIREFWRGATPLRLNDLLAAIALEGE